MKIKSFLIKFLIIICIFLAAIVVLYKSVLPNIICSKFTQNYLKKTVEKTFDLDLSYKNPNFKTYFPLRFSFSVENLSVKKGDIALVELNDFKSEADLSNISKKQIKINKLCADTLIVKADKLLEAIKIEQKENEKQTPFDWKIFIDENSDISLDNMELSYIYNKVPIEIYTRDIAVSQNKDYKNLGFNLEVNVLKDNKPFINVVSSTLDEIKIYDDKIEVDKLKVLINNSRLMLSSDINPQNISLNAKSDRFFLSDIFKIITSNLIIPNGETILAPLKNEDGKVAFNVNMDNGDLSGFINIDNTKASIKDLSNLPINIQKGKIVISKDKIDFKGLEGYWGKSKNNTVTIEGDIKDYYKTFDTNLNIRTGISNEFFRDYLAKLMGGTSLFVSKPSHTKIVFKSKNNIMDITLLAKIAKGVNFGVEDTKSALSDYDRALKGDFRIEGDKLEIKNINYYIASSIQKGVKIKPIIIADGKMDLTGKIDNMGFSFGRAMPAEFLNIFLGQKVFKKGTIQGSMHVAFKNNIPYLICDMELDKTFVPSQRLALKHAYIKSDEKIINLDMEGRFKRANYKFNGKIKNELKAPYIIKNLALDIDNIDIERFLASMNNQGQDKKEVVNENEGLDDDYMFDTNLIRIEKADFSLQKGNYKELQFGNIKALLTLDEKGILKIHSNKFDIAQGISTLKVECDLKNLKYYVRLGVKDVDSNLISKVLLNLDKEISGKAKGLIELYGDKSLKLNGDIKFSVDEGTIGKIGLVEYVLKIASVFRNPVVMISPGTIMDIINVPEGRFDKISGSLNIKDNVVRNINIKSSSPTLSALIRGRFDMERHDASLRIYTRFSTDRKSVFGFLRNMSLNTLANKVQMNTRNDANYYESELKELPSIEVDDDKAQVFLTQVEGDVEHFNFISSLKKIK